MNIRFKLALSALTIALSANVIAKDELVVFSLPNLSSPFEVQLQKVALETSKKLDVKLQVLDGQSSSTKQASDLENAITRGAKGIIISPNDVNAISATVEEIVNEKIPTATLDRKIQSTKDVPHFGANNYTGGQEVAKAVKTKYPDGAKIILLTGQPGSTSNIERTKGIRDELAIDNKKYQIIVDQTGNWLRSEGLRIVESVLPTLKTTPDVIIAVNDDMALGAIEALKSQGYHAGDIAVTGFDAVPEALARIKDNWLFVTADQRPGYAVSSAMEQIVGNIREKKAVSGADYPPKIISKQNIQEAERFAEVSE